MKIICKDLWAISKTSIRIFYLFKNYKKWSGFLNFGCIWLVNELVLTFSAPIKSAKAQFKLIILSRVIEYTTYRQTDRHFRKNHFFWLRGSQNDLMKISKVIFHIKQIPSLPWWECKNKIFCFFCKYTFYSVHGNY